MTNQAANELDSVFLLMCVAKCKCLVHRDCPHLQRRPLFGAVCISEHVGGPCSSSLRRKCLPKELHIILSICHCPQKVPRPACHQNKSEIALPRHCPWHGTTEQQISSIKRVILVSRLGVFRSILTYFCLLESQLHMSPPLNICYLAWLTLSSGAL